MSKKSAAAAAQLVKLIVPAGKASAQPPVGPALGAKGVKAMDFAKEFNAKTAHMEVGIPTPCVGSGAAGSQIIGTISLKHVYEIAKIKQPDLPSMGEEQLCKTIMGTAKSMGIRVVR